jgi:hypothetical protein
MQSPHPGPALLLTFSVCHARFDSGGVARGATAR